MKRISKCQSWRLLKGYWVSKLAPAVNGWGSLHADYKGAAHAPMIKSELVRRIARQTPHLHQRDVENIGLHPVRCFDGAGGGSWRDGSSRGSSSLRPCA